MGVVALDPGTANLVCAWEDADGNVKVSRLRNVFFEVPNDGFSKKMLGTLKVPEFEVGGKLYLAGNEAFELAKTFGKELQFTTIEPAEVKVADAASPVARVAAVSTDKTIAVPPVARGPDLKSQESDKGDSAAPEPVSRDASVREPESSRLVPVLILIAAVALATAGISLYRRHHAK